jgi:hypothetical protein
LPDRRGSPATFPEKFHGHHACGHPALIALLAGILILIMPRLFNYVVAIYLIIIGILGLFPNLLHGV